MLSNATVKTVLTILPLVFFCACDPNSDREDENIIGNRLEIGSSLSEVENSKMLNIYDEVINRVHTFDLQNNILVQSTEVVDSGEKHFVIASDDSSFFISLSQKEITVHSYDGSNGTHYGALLKGNPVSSAYNRTTNHLVVYDDLNSIALLKPALENLDFSNVWVGGPLITGEKSIQAGEILDDGTLVLSLIDGSLVKVDVDSSIQEKKWIYTIDSFVAAQNIKWIGNVGGGKILYQNTETLTLYDTSTNTVLDTSDLPKNSYTLEYSKSGSPHVIYKQKRTAVHSLAFVDGDTIVTRDFVGLDGVRSFHQSRLDLESGEWSYIGALTELKDYFDFSEQERGLPKKGRTVIRHRLSDMLVMNNDALPDDAYLKRTKTEVFALYPSELGYAKVINIDGRGSLELYNFNIPYIRPGMRKSLEDF